MGQLAKINTKTDLKLKSKTISSKPKTAEDIEREAFYKKVNDPSNFTLEESRQSTLKYAKELWGK